MRTSELPLVIIERFRDGDTVEIWIRCSCCRKASYEVLRIKGVESFEPNGAERTYAQTAARGLDSLYAGKRAVFVGSMRDRDNYGRLLGDLLFDGSLLSELVIQSGMSWRGVGAEAPSECVDRVAGILSRRM